MKRINRLLFFLLVEASSPILAGEFDLNEASFHTDGRNFALGGTLCTATPNKNHEISIHYLLPYQLKDLSTRSLKIGQKAFGINWEGLWFQKGNAAYEENTLCLRSSRKLSGSILLGVGGYFYRFSTLAGKKGSSWFGEVESKYQLSDKVEISLLLINPAGARMIVSDKSVPVSRSAHGGLSLFPVKSTMVVTELEIRSNQDPAVHFGLEYELCESLILRTGVSSSPFCPSWGIGGKRKKISYAYAGNLHSVLGLSSCFSLYYQW
jgi:hypothetical protein